MPRFLVHSVGVSPSSRLMHREALSHSAPPCIPYLGVHLSDLTFIEDGNPDTIRGLVNFTKRRFLFRVISEISRYQQNAYNLHPVPQIQVLSSLHDLRRYLIRA